MPNIDDTRTNICLSRNSGKIGERSIAGAGSFAQQRAIWELGRRIFGWEI
jgi:hypothetical protein